MAVCRIEKSSGYTVMSNYHLADKSLSLKAVGLLSKMLSLPEDWDYTVFGLTRICKEGRDAIRAAISELEEAGYIHRRQLRDESGNFSDMEYIIYERPMPEQPMSENPTSENPTQLNTKLINYLNNTPPIVPPHGGRAREVKKKVQEDKGSPGLEAGTV